MGIGWDRRVEAGSFGNSFRARARMFLKQLNSFNYTLNCHDDCGKPTQQRKSCNSHVLIDFSGMRGWRRRLPVITTVTEQQAQVINTSYQAVTANNRLQAAPPLRLPPTTAGCLRVAPLAAPDHYYYET